MLPPRPHPPARVRRQRAGRLVLPPARLPRRRPAAAAARGRRRGRPLHGGERRVPRRLVPGHGVGAGAGGRRCADPDRRPVDLAARDRLHDRRGRYGWNSRWNGYLSRFEREFAEYVGAEYAIATSSCTGALHMAMLAIGVGPGDEAIVPEQTWVATAKAVTYVGATPVFADVEPGSWCLDAASVEAAITERTKAVVPVHLYGHPADMDALQAVADRHGLPLIEDAAPAIGAEIRGRRVGALGT